ncbi:hypothetical protein BGX29_001208 [Mortierella sp. GBA35]|nr:hypothetical protein BGX29_001208 [Mortierella sp. GBA35]
MLSTISPQGMIRERPLDISELRTRVSRFLDLRDVLSCALVCRVWSQDFVPILWHTIDFSIQPRIRNANLKTTKKLGKNIQRLYSIQLSHLHFLSTVFCNNPQVNAHGYDLISRNRTSLTYLKVTVRTTLRNFNDITPHHYIPPDVLVHPTCSRLTDLILENVCLAREGFTTILQLSPLLQKINLTESCILTGGYAYEREEAKKGSVSLGALIPEPFDDVEEEEEEEEVEEDEEEEAGNEDGEDDGDDGDAEEDEETEDAAQTGGVDEEVPFQHLNICICQVIGAQEGGQGVMPTPLVGRILALIHMRPSTLSSPYTDAGFDIDNDNVPPIENGFRKHGRGIQLLFQILPLQVVNLYNHEMKLEWMMEKPWKTSLRELSVSIQGMDTKEKIEKTLRLWLDCWKPFFQVPRLSTTTHAAYPSAQSQVEEVGDVGQVGAEDPVVEQGQADAVGCSTRVDDQGQADGSEGVTVAEEQGQEEDRVETGNQGADSTSTALAPQMTTLINVSGDGGLTSFLEPQYLQPLDVFEDDGSFEARVTRFLVVQPNLTRVLLTRL